MDETKKKLQMNRRRKKRAEHFYATAICLLLPLLLLKFELAYLSPQAILLLAITLRILVVQSRMLWNNQINLKKPENATDWIVAGVLVMQFLRILLLMLDTSKVGAIAFETELVILLLCIQYWVLKSGIIYKRIYLDLLLYVGLLIVALNLLETLAQIPIGLRARTVFAQDGVLLTFLILISAVAIIRFCESVDRYQQMTYGALATLSVFALFLEKSLIGICILSLVFPFLLVKGSKQLLYVKRVLLVAFAYFFLLSNMPLMIEVLALKQLEGFYQLEYSVYLDLILATAGVFILHYWEKHYEKEEEASKQIPEVENIAKWILYLAAILFLGSILLGVQGENLAKLETMKLIHLFSGRLLQELKTYPNALLQAATNQSWLGLFAILVFLAILWERLWNERMREIVASEVWIVSMLGLVQLFVLPVSVYVTPIYALLIGFTLFGIEDTSKKHYQELRIQLERKNGF